MFAVVVCAGCGSADYVPPRGGASDPAASAAPAPPRLNALGSAFDADSLAPQGGGAADPHAHHHHDHGAPAATVPAPSAAPVTP